MPITGHLHRHLNVPHASRVRGNMSLTFPPPATLPVAEQEQLYSRIMGTKFGGEDAPIDVRCALFCAAVLRCCLRVVLAL